MPCIFKKLLLFALLIMSYAANAQVVASFTADNTQGCAPLVVHFTNTSTNATSYSWNLGNGTTTAQQDASGSFTSSGTYTVTLTATGPNNTTSTYTMTITVFAAPVVNFTVDDSGGCPGYTANFTAQYTAGVPGPCTYIWSFGDGSTSTLLNPPHTYGAPGQYNVALAITNASGCVSTLTKTGYITVFTPPVISINLPSSIFCSLPAVAAFQNNTTGTPTINYTWRFGDGSTSGQATPTHQYTNPPV